jgi:hypothetical protein
VHLGEEIELFVVATQLKLRRACAVQQVGDDLEGVPLIHQKLLPFG